MVIFHMMMIDSPAGTTLTFRARLSDDVFGWISFEPEKNSVININSAENITGCDHITVLENGYIFGEIK
jgi:hypothetical protein